MDHILHALVQAAALGVPGAALAWILRAARAPGGPIASAIVAGISIGLLAGPGVLGTGWPARYEQLFGGAGAEAEAVGTARARQADETAALRVSGVSPVAIRELVADHELRLAPLLDDLDAARAAQRTRLDWLAQCVLALHLVLIGPSLMPAARRSARLVRGITTVGIACAGVGVLGATMAIVVPAMFDAVLMRAGALHAVAFGIIMGAPALSAAMRPGPYIAGWCGAGIALGAAIVFGWSPGMTVVGAGVFLGLMAALGIGATRRLRRVRRAGAFIAFCITLPLITALIAVRIDLRALNVHDPAALWAAVLVGVLWSSDGRWGAWWLAWRYLGPPEARTVAWTCAAQNLGAGTGVVPIGLALVLSAAGVVDDAVVAGALLGAATVELMRGARAWLAVRLDENAARSSS